MPRGLIASLGKSYGRLGGRNQGGLPRGSNTVKNSHRIKKELATEVVRVL